MGVNWYGFSRTFAEVYKGKRHDPYYSRSSNEDGKVHSNSEHGHEYASCGLVSARSGLESRIAANIVSDRDPRFTAKFWEALQKALGVKPLMSTAAHPQTDGQAEATVKIVQKLLRPFVFQGQDWGGLLPTLEFAYNDMQQSSTGQTPFYLNYEYHPTGVIRHEPVDNPHAED